MSYIDFIKISFKLKNSFCTGLQLDVVAWDGLYLCFMICQGACTRLHLTFDDGHTILPRNFIVNGWGPNRVFGKTEDYGFLSVKNLRHNFWQSEEMKTGISLNFHM